MCQPLFLMLTQIFNFLQGVELRQVNFKRERKYTKDRAAALHLKNLFRKRDSYLEESDFNAFSMARRKP